MKRMAAASPKGAPPVRDDLIPHLFRLGMAELKYETARELGLIDAILKVGWAGVSAKECGRVGGTIAARQGDRLIRLLIAAPVDGAVGRAHHLVIRRRFRRFRRRGANPSVETGSKRASESEGRDTLRG